MAVGRIFFLGGGRVWAFSFLCNHFKETGNKLTIIIPEKDILDLPWGQLPTANGHECNWPNILNV